MMLWISDNVNKNLDELHVGMRDSEIQVFKIHVQDFEINALQF